jgi:hypothetical protein
VRFIGADLAHADEETDRERNGAEPRRHHEERYEGVSRASNAA